MNATKEYRNKFSIYKPNKAGTGSAVQFDFNLEKKCVFVEVARQKPPVTGDQTAIFNWGEKLIVKLNVPDIAKLLVVLNGKVPTVELFHDPSKSKFVIDSSTRNATASITKGTVTGYFFKVSLQSTSGQVNFVQVVISEDEAVVLKLLLEEAIKKSYAW